MTKERRFVALTEDNNWERYPFRTWIEYNENETILKELDKLIKTESMNLSDHFSLDFTKQLTESEVELLIFFSVVDSGIHGSEVKAVGDLDLDYIIDKDNKDNMNREDIFYLLRDIRIKNFRKDYGLSLVRPDINLDKKLYMSFVEKNNWEGEVWRIWIDVSQNKDALKELKEYLEENQKFLSEFSLGDRRPLNEHQIDTLIDNSHIGAFKLDSKVEGILDVNKLKTELDNTSGLKRAEHLTKGKIAKFFY